jgi:succinyl-diaminopimelate desuccinylase
MDVIRLCSDLVRIRSENPPGSTDEIIHYIRGYLESLGVPTRVIASSRGRSNLLTGHSRHPLLFCAHVDVVPAIREGWQYDPYVGHTDDTWVWGRGSTDMKGGCAAILSAYHDVIDAGEEPAVDLLFVCDEETSGTHGIRCVLSKGILRPCDVVIGEPTPPLHPNIGQKGLCRLDIVFSGVPGHASFYPERGVSAVMEAYRFLEFLGKIHEREYHGPPGMEPLLAESSRVLSEALGIPEADRILRRVTYNPGRIEGGEKVNMVAQSCHLEVDMRIPWGCDLSKILEECREHARNAGITLVSRAEPSVTPPDSTIAGAVCGAVSEVYGATATPIVQWAASDARFLRGSGYAVVEYGPGDITTMHAVDERVPVDALRKAQQVYAALIREYGGIR